MTTPRRPERRGRRDAVLALAAGPVVGWAVARLVVLGALALSSFLADELGAEGDRAPSGLLGWDADWYLRIVADGYGELPEEALRFFPLLPILARALRPVLGPRLALLLVVNVAALAAGMLLARLVRLERGDDALADRAGLLFALLPPAFVLVMGYAEALFVLTAVAAFLALRTGRYGWAALAGLLCGLSRPLGILLVLPAVVEVARGWRRERSAGGRAARVVAVLAPVAGLASYLTWTLVRFGDAFLPVTLQQEAGRRGGFDDPASRLVHAGSQLLDGAELGSGLHLPWALAFLVLLVLTFRRWPVSYGLFASAILLVALSAENLDSLERYGLSAFPLVVTLADLLRPQWAERTAVAVCGAGIAVYATLAFLGSYVP